MLTELENVRSSHTTIERTILIKEESFQKEIREHKEKFALISSDYTKLKTDFSSIQSRLTLIETEKRTMREEFESKISVFESEKRAVREEYETQDKCE